MSRHLSSLLFIGLISASTVTAVPSPPTSPQEMAAATERWLVEGAGARFPEGMSFPAREADRFVFVDDAWPLPFQDRIGEAITLRISGQTGCYEFVDGAGSVFWTVVPVAPLTWDWVSPFRSPDRPATRGLYSPFRLAREWTLVSHAENAESSDGASAAARLPSHAEFAENAEPFLLDLRFVDNPTNLCFTAFSCTETNLLFTAFWPTNDILPEGVLDLYGTSNLLSSSWTLLSSHPATNPPVSFEVERASLPWFDATPPHVHDATCLVSTNVVLSPFDGTTVYTNVVWSCSTNRPPGETGFFRLGTRADADGDGLTDAFEILVTGSSTNSLDTDLDGLFDDEEFALGTDPLSADTDGDGLPDNEEVFILGTSPQVADTDGDGLTDLEEVGSVEPFPYEWRASGDAPNLLSGEWPDEGVLTISLAGPLVADRTPHARIAVDTNGIVFLLEPGGSVTNAHPTPHALSSWTNGPAHLSLAALWGGMVPDEDSTLKFFETETVSVVEFGDFLPLAPPSRSFPDAATPLHTQSGGRVSLQVVLPRTVENELLVHYREVPEGGISAAAVVGLQNRDRGYFTLPPGKRYVLPRPGEEPLSPASGTGLRYRLGLGTNPLVADTDGDGLPDGEEASAGTNPLRTDTDLDGISDAAELAAGTDPKDPADKVGYQSGSLIGNGAAGVPVLFSETFPIPKATAALVGVWAASREYPQYTSQSSQYNDTLVWTVATNGVTVLSGATDVNALHSRFIQADQAGHTVPGVTGPAVDLGWALLSAPVGEDLEVALDFRVTNVSDGDLPSTLMAAICPLRVVQANWPVTRTTTDFGTRRSKRIFRDGIAYVTGEPAAPALTAVFQGLSECVAVDWRLDLTTERSERGALDNRHIPASGWIMKPGDEAWDIAAELDEIVGGTNTISIRINGMSVGSFAHFIRGKNPEDKVVEAFVRANIPPPDDDIVLAIARHENRWGRYVYNQFNPGPDSYVEKLDFGSPGGWGICQIDRSGFGGTTTTEEAWNWKANILSGMSVFAEKVGNQTTFINRFRREYGLSGDWTEPPGTYVHVPETGIALPPATWGGIVLYNGTNGVPASTAVGHTFASPWTFTPESGWNLWDNNNSYAEKISLEMHGGNKNAQE